jgi:asparagine synthase (glutamine-hydrolysing)
MMQPLRSLSQSFDNIVCAMSGGRDSRLMATLLIHAGVPAQYYTYGDPSGIDAQVARRIAERFNLPYETIRVTASDMMANWDQACRESVRQSDGMTPLQLVAGTTAYMNQQIDRIDIRMWGVGGEIARAFYHGTHSQSGPLCLRRHDGIGVKHHLAESLVRDHNGLVRREAVDLSREYVHRFVSDRLDDGFAPLDIPDAFYAYQRVGRRGGTNMRRSMAIRDAFSPYITRAFVEAAFSVAAMQRYTEPLHYRITELLSPEMHSLPFNPVGTGPWPPQQPVLNLLQRYGAAKLHKVTHRWSRITSRLFNRTERRATSAHIARDSMFDRLGWIEAQREQLREMCLDRNGSQLWDLVDRSLFDRITSSSTEPQDRSHYVKILYHIFTLFYYEGES